MHLGRMKSRVLISLFSVTAVLFILPGMQAKAAAAEKSCVTAKCHSSMGKAKHVHGPVAMGECTFCHQPTASHTFKPIKNAGKLCYNCHDQFAGRTCTLRSKKANARNAMTRISRQIRTSCGKRARICVSSAMTKTWSAANTSTAPPR